MVALASLIVMVLLAPLLAEEAKPGRSAYDVPDFGAKGDGRTMETKSIQSPIDACAKACGQDTCHLGRRHTPGRGEFMCNLEHGLRLISGTPFAFRDS